MTIPEEEEEQSSTQNAVKTAVNTSATPASTAPNNYVLQMASLQSSQDAGQVADALKSAGYKTFVQSYKANDKSTWYRVMVGPFNHLKTAQAEQNKLYAQKMSALLLKVSSN